VTWRRRATTSEQAQRAGEDFSKVLRAGDIVLLEGPLGAGKTTFVQGVARGLGVTERVTSPTFTVVRQHACHGHPSISTLHHADVYRIHHLDEVVDLALGELVEERGVALVEWGELAASVFGDDVLRLSIAVDDDDVRIVTVTMTTEDRRESLDAWSSI